MNTSKAHKQKHQKKPREHTDIALERILSLFREAENCFQKEPKLSNKYISQALKIARKYKVKLPSGLKRRFCSSCGIFLLPPQNCRVRLTEGKASYTCLSCGMIMRFPYTKKKISPKKQEK